MLLSQVEVSNSIGRRRVESITCTCVTDPEHSVALPDTNDVIRRFNRDTGWLATGVLGAVVFAALVLAVLVQERHPKAVDLTEEASAS